ncbi:YppG family protein [Rossellomorea sp. NS-SX7]|uniref:YppG family protein n=1 Tax=Rossellomorea sp. NS-SX7 TaxID=3463856 RepID=UPI004058D8A9
MNSHRYRHRYQNYYPYPYPNPSTHQLVQMGNYQMQGEGQYYSPPFHYSPEPVRPNGQMTQVGYTNPYFENPLQHEEYNPYQMKAMQQQNYANPYPKASFMAKKSNSGMGTIMNSFKSQDGSFDFNKVMNTAGQMMGTVNQVSSLVKGLGGMFKF